MKLLHSLQSSVSLHVISTAQPERIGYRREEGKKRWILCRTLRSLSLGLWHGSTWFSVSLAGLLVWLLFVVGTSDAAVGVAWTGTAASAAAVHHTVLLFVATVLVVASAAAKHIASTSIMSTDEWLCPGKRPRPYPRKLLLLQ